MLPKLFPRSECVPFEYGRLIDKEKVKAAWVGEHMIRDKDVIVMGIDTVMDNIHYLDIGDIVHAHLNEDFVVSDIDSCAKDINDKAVERST